MRKRASEVSGLWSVAPRKRAFYKNLTAELSGSFLAQGGGGVGSDLSAGKIR